MKNEHLLTQLTISYQKGKYGLYQAWGHVKVEEFKIMLPEIEAENLEQIIEKVDKAIGEIALKIQGHNKNLKR